MPSPETPPVSGVPQRAGGPPEGEASPPRVAPLGWQRNAWFFVATVASCFVTQFDVSAPRGIAALHAVEYTAALLAILVSHELGHYVTARIHKVDASLPYFLPMPILSPFGTMGAVIRMRSVIPTRRALLDIGASGPLAGMAVAIPLYAWGVSSSRLVPLDGTSGGMILGDSILGRVLDHFFAQPVPEGMDIALSPVAFAAWAGMFVTMINLLPLGQLDGGHVAFALFGPRQDRLARWVHRSVLAFFFVSLGSFVVRDLHAGLGLWRLGRNVGNAVFWLVWFEVLAVIGSMSSRAGPGPLTVRTRAVATLGLALLAGIARDKTSPVVWGAWFVGLGLLLAMEVRWGALRPDSALLDHPPTGAEPLGKGRAAVAVVTLALFVLLFMPTPLAL
jgi:membrane-associated protease RseP (regulator of RpoE activity)